MKTICVPKNKEALNRLDYDQTKENDLFEVSLEDNVFFELSQTGFFRTINELAHSNIDDFEDEAIIDEAYLNIILKSDIFNQQKYNLEIFKVVKNIEDLFVSALECKTGVFFYF